MQRPLLTVASWDKCKRALVHQRTQAQVKMQIHLTVGERSFLVLLSQSCWSTFCMNLSILWLSVRNGDSVISLECNSFFREEPNWQTWLRAVLAQSLNYSQHLLRFSTLCFLVITSIYLNSCIEMQSRFWKPFLPCKANSFPYCDN